MTRLLAPLLLVALASPVLAQKAAPVAKKPTADQILDRYALVTGGPAWEKLTSFTAKGTVSLPAQSIKGTVEINAKAPNKIAVKQAIGGVGETLSGFDGKEGWSKDPFSGLRVLSGAELSQLEAQATLSLRPTQWRKQYAKAELLGTTKVGGAPAYKVRLTPKVGSPETQYFDVKTGLQVRSDQVAETPQGKIPVEGYLSDYRTVAGVKIPFKTRQVASTTEAVIQFTEVKTNIALDDTLFAKPK